MGCHHNQDYFETTISNQLRVVLDTLYTQQETKRLDSLRHAFRLSIGEPDIDTFKWEVFSFEYDAALGASFIARIEQLPDSSVRLTFKYIITDAPVFRKHDVAPWRMVKNYYSADTLAIYKEEQMIDKNDFSTFKDIVLGAYYWAFTNPRPDFGGSDGDYLSMISKSVVPYSNSRDTLKYHENLIPWPYNGSFTRAYNYLANRSKLFKILKDRNDGRIVDFDDPNSIDRIKKRPAR